MSRCATQPRHSAPLLRTLRAPRVSCAVGSSLPARSSPRLGPRSVVFLFELLGALDSQHAITAALATSCAGHKAGRCHRELATDATVRFHHAEREQNSHTPYLRAFGQRAAS